MWDTGALAQEIDGFVPDYSIKFDTEYYAPSECTLCTQTAHLLVDDRGVE
jgi:hypothetical protein